MTMRALGIYWLIGCLFTGIMFGKAVDWCPNDKTPIHDVLILTAVWPVIVVMAAVSTRKPEKICGDGTPFRVTFGEDAQPAAQRQKEG